MNKNPSILILFDHENLIPTDLLINGATDEITMRLQKIAGWMMTNLRDKRDRDQ